MSLRPKTLKEFVSQQMDAKERRLKRRAKARSLWGAVSQTRVRAQLWEVFALFIKLRDKRINRGLCRICGKRPIEVAYHLVPQQRGDATRYREDNVVGACCGCNYGEVRNRSLYREKHIDLFTRDHIERLEKIAREAVQLSTAQLVELRDHYKARLEGRIP